MISRPTLLAALLLSSTAWAADNTSFRTPSDNIHCTFHDWNGEMVACEIRNRTTDNPPIPRPADCDFEWGDTLELPVNGAASLSCHGDTIRTPDAPILQYGTSIERFGITCRSEKTGVTCTNSSAHGFFVSRARQQLF